MDIESELFSTIVSSVEFTSEISAETVDTVGFFSSLLEIELDWISACGIACVFDKSKCIAPILSEIIDSDLNWSTKMPIIIEAYKIKSPNNFFMGFEYIRLVYLKKQWISTDEVQNEVKKY